MRRIIAAVVLAAALAACGSSNYEFTPDVSTEDGSPHDVKCGVVEWVVTNWYGRTTYEGIGHLCRDTSTEKGGE